MSVSNDRISLLVVEDNTGDFVLIEEYLRDEFLAPDIHHAKNFKEAAELLQSDTHFDAVLLDLSLPDADKEELVTNTLELEATVPVVVLTGYANKEFGVKTLSLGVSDYLLKDELNGKLLKRSISYSIERKKINRSLEESEKEYKNLFDLNPLPMWVFDLETYSFLDVNQAAIDHYGYTEDEFLNMTIKDIRPDEEVERLLQKLSKSKKTGGRLKGVWKHRKKNGELIDVEVSSNNTLYKGIPARMVLANDISAKLVAEKSVLKKSKLLTAGSEVISALLQKGEWKEVLEKTLGIVGDALEADRVYYFENYKESSNKEMFTRYNEWTRIDITPQIDNPEFQRIPLKRFKELVTPLLNNDPFKAVISDLPECNTRKLLESQSILSVLVIPIYVNNFFCGFIGIDDCTRERIWSDEEVQFLDSLASNFAIAIEKREAIDELVLSEQRFKALVQDGSDLIAIIDRNANYMYVAPSSETVLGIPAGEFLNKNALHYIHDDDKLRIVEALSELPQKGSMEIEPFRFRDAEGNWRWIVTVVTNMMDNPAVQGYVTNSRDVTQWIEAQEELRQLSLVASKTTDVVIVTDPDQRITWVNKAFEKLTGYTFEQARGEVPGKLLQGPESDPETIERLRKAIRQRESVEEVILNYAKNGRKYWVELNIDPIFDEEGNCTHFIAIQRDVTKRKKEEERLKLLESVITNTKESVVILEAEPSERTGRKIIYVNDAFTEMTGYSREETVGRTLNFLYGEKTDKKELLRLRNAIDKWESGYADLINFRKNGEPIWVNISMVPVADKNGKYTHWISISRDITKRRKQEEEILNSLKEKETLLAEVHHRVKNNLAVISAMLQLQAYQEGNEAISAALIDSMSRIKTIANIHEHLYQSSTFSRVDFTKNTKKLVSDIIDTMDIQKEIELDFNCESVELNVNQAIPCSLIVNEVVTNSLKHAFNGKDRGILSISLQQNEENITLEIKDNGVGLTENFDSDKGETLGLQIISVLSQQLKAEYNFDSSAKGTGFTIKFKKAEPRGIGSGHVL